MATQPGTTFVYNSGAAHLVSAVVTDPDRPPAAAFAAKRLFAPLGIRQHKWLTAPGGHHAPEGSACSCSRATSPSSPSSTFTTDAGTAARSSPPPGSSSRRPTTSQTRRYEYGYLWWLDRADGYAYMAGLYGQLAVVDPGKDLVAVITAHFPATVDANSVNRWLLETYILPAAR